MKLKNVSTPHGGLATHNHLNQKMLTYLCFNSTRWISNQHKLITIYRYHFNVSTPHGGLATGKGNKKGKRNKKVSTPHGGLATQVSRRCKRNISYSFNSTRWISNRLPAPRPKQVFKVSTPHGGLATQEQQPQPQPHQQVSTPHGGLATQFRRMYERFKSECFNSTRWISNRILRAGIRENIVSVSTPHGGLATTSLLAFGFMPRMFQLHTVD